MTAPGVAPGDRSRRFRALADRLWRRVAVVSFVFAIAIPIGLLVGFRLIITSSVPKGLWFVHGGAVVRGEYVLFCLPANIALEGREAGYLIAGACPGNTLPLMKRVVALAGDSVLVTPRGVRVNGKMEPDSRPLRRDSRGRPIPGRVPVAQTTVAAGEMWVLGDWYKSWDSRYFGSVARWRVIGIGKPLITKPAGS